MIEYGELDLSSHAFSVIVVLGETVLAKFHAHFCRQQVHLECVSTDVETSTFECGVGTRETIGKEQNERLLAGKSTMNVC